MRQAAIAVFVALSCSLAPESHVLSLGFSQGQESRYSFHLISSQTEEMGGVRQTTTIDIRAVATQTVQSVGTDGVADVTLTLSNLNLTTTVQGETSETELDSLVPYQSLRLASDARQLALNRLGVAAVSPLGAANSAGAPVWAVLPSRAVMIGDSWTKSYMQTNPLGTGVISIKARSRYLRDEAVNGSSTAVVHAASEASVDIVIDSVKLPSTAYVQPPRSQTGVAGVIERTITLVTSTRIQGWTTAEVTTWLDVASRRVVKTEMTSAVTGTMVLAVAPIAALGGTEAPYTFTGSQKLTMEPM